MRIGIVGATGVVGRELVSIIGDSKLGPTELRLSASSKSVGKVIPTEVGEQSVSALNLNFFRNLDYCFFCVSTELSRKWVPEAVALGVKCIDNSSAFRMEPEIPIIIPEVNGHLLNRHPRVVANPNCCVAQLAVALNPISLHFGLEEVWVSSYQSVSGAGQWAIEQLQSECAQSPKVCKPGQFFLNILPSIGAVDEQGHSQEESKIVRETRKILNLPGLPMSVSSARVPVLRGHCLAVSIVTELSTSAEEMGRCLAGTENIVLTKDGLSPQPAMVQYTNQVYVGRIRANKFHKLRSYSFWVAADNLRKGAAHNALKIAEKWCTLK